jgi:hypothetical protein
LLARVLLLLAFVGLLVILLAGVVVRVIVRRTRVVVIVVGGGGGGGLVIGLLWFSGVVFMSDFGFPFPISHISVLGLLSHEEKGFWLAITSRDFILEAVWKSFVKLVSKGGVTPITVRGQRVKMDEVFRDMLTSEHFQCCQLILHFSSFIVRAKVDF